MVVIRALHAPRRRRMRGRRPTPAAPTTDAPDAVPITRATVIATNAFSDADSAAAWLRSCTGRDGATADLEEALSHVNQVLSAHRVAAHDPYVRDVAAADVLRVRLGFGTGEEIVDGRWRDAYVIPLERAQRRPRRRMLSPDEEMAGMLTGRRPAARPSEHLLLHARRDLDHGRLVEAALITRAALDALAAEGVETEEKRADAARIADAALKGDLSPERAAELAELVGDLERGLRRRRYAD